MKEQDDAMVDLALGEAEAAAARGEVPIGAVLVSAAGEMLAKAGNRVIELKDPTAHGEMLVLRAAASLLGNERLIGTTLYVTIEHGPRFFAQPTCHHRPEIARAGNADAAARLLKEFFQARRDPPPS